jgi:putative membrane protein
VAEGSGSQGPEGTDHAEPDVRFSLANERTLLAYQRTAIGLMGAAIAVSHFFGTDPVVLTLSAALIVTAAIAAVGGYQHFRQVDTAIRTGRPMTAGPAAHLLSVAMVVCLALAAAYVLSRVLG